MLFIRAALPLTMLLLSGCIVGPEYKAPEIQLPSKFSEAAKTSNGDVATVAWRSAFNDSRLNGYVKSGLSQNLTVLQVIERAAASLDAAYATADVQRLTLISAVASAYIDVRYYQEHLEIARQNLGPRRETLNLTKLQLGAGAASRLDVVQSEGLVNSTLAQMPSLEISFRRASHRELAWHACRFARPGAHARLAPARCPQHSAHRRSSRPYPPQT